MKVVMVDISFQDYSIETNIFKQAGMEFKVYVDSEINNLVPLIKDADVLLVGCEEVSSLLIEQMPKLKLIGRCGVGVDNIDLIKATELGIPVINVPDYCTEEVAVTACSMILTAQRKIMIANDMVKENRWSDLTALKPIKAFSELTLGLIGLGKIGSNVAELMRPFGCKICVYDPYLGEDIIDEDMHLVSLEELLTSSDIISIHCPLTAGTKHLINNHTISKMQKRPMLINVSRGSIVNEKDLIEALNNSLISYAALDVLEKEPPSSDNPLINHPKVLVTNHIAWYSESSEPRLRTMLAKRVVDYFEGKLVPTIVNRKELNI